MNNIPVLQTERLVLNNFGNEHFTDEYIAWLNDPEIVKYSEQRHKKHDRQSCQGFVDSFANSANYLWAICTKQGEHIGNLSVTVDVNNKLADIAIMIGNKKYWGAGYGGEAFNHVLNYLLENDIARKVTAGTMAKNESMLKILKNSAMQEEARRQGHYLLDGVPTDIVYFAKWKEDV